MVFFSKLNDSVDSLLNSGYKALGAFSVKNKSKTKNGAKLEVSAKRKNGKDDVTGGIKFSKTYTRDEISFDLTENVKEDGTIGSEVEISGFAEGVKLKFASTLLQTCETDIEALAEDKESKKTRNEITGELSFKNDKISAEASLNKKQLNTPKFNFNIAGKVHDDVVVGVNFGVPLVKLSQDAGAKLCDTDITFRAVKDDLVVVGQLTETGTDASLGVVHKCSDKFSVGVEFTGKGVKFPWCYRRAEVEEESKEEGEESKEEVEESKEEVEGCCKARSWGFTTGFQYKNDDDSVFRAKINDRSVATCSYEFPVSDNLRANVVAETQVCCLGQGSKLGVSFTFSN